ncbi:hypothetical protein J32TS6_19230 [Virgibacillus pantothenticus]|uniref:phage tail tape measure protein n=1 Tax=Virgibacillus pantothenticus TaxID=1473 RepID=UPI001B01BD90|nr:phage tail tape measure protein [Virgibacillus pantothenticus]GIP63368.1 hypothetical protein J32TS6_19230 [Virgibacillus pantothenticus]
MQRIEGLSIALDLDTLRLDRGLTGLKDRLRTVNSEMRSNMSAFDRGDKSVAKYETRLRGLNKKLEVQKAVTKAAKAEYQKMVDEYGEGSKEAEKAAREYNNQAAALNNLDRYVSNTREELEKLKRQQEFANSRWGKMSSNLDDFSKRMDKTGTKMMSAGRTMTTHVTLPVLGLGTAAFKMASDFESAFAGVKKTVDMSEKGYKKLEIGIRDMAKELPVAATDIAAVAESAGQLGIENNSILKFTKTVIDLGEATNMTREQAATEFARFANIVNMSQKDFDRLGSSVVALGNNMATTESEITSMAMRLAAQGSQVGMTEAQIMALSATMSSLGIEAEAGGTAMTTVLKKIDKAVGDGGKSLQGFAKAAGVSSSDFAKAWKKDPVTALDMFIKGLGKSSEEGKNLTTILSDLGIKGIREADTILRMAGASDLLSEAVDNSTTAWEENSALTKEAEQRYKTTQSQLKILMNRIKDVGITLGNALIPAVIDAIDAAEPFIKKIESGAKAFSEMDKSQQQTILKTIALTAAIGPLSFVFGGAFRAIGMFTGGLSKVIKFFGKTQLNSKAAGKSLLGFGGVVSKSGTQAVKTSVGFGKVAGTLGGVGRIAGIARLGLSALGGPMGLLATIAIPALIDGGIKLVNHLKEESIPAVTGFGDKVSESTTKAILGYEKLNDEATTQLNQLFWSGQAITEEGSQKLIQTFSSMTNQIAENMKTKFEESYQSMSDFFASSKALSDKEEQAILTKIQDGHLKQQQEIQKNEDRIKEILNTASQEKRSLTKAEKKEINQIQDSMRKTAVQTMSKSQIEQEAIMTELKNNSGNITARQAAETVKNSKKAKDGSVKEANKKFNEVRNWAIYERDVTGNLSKEEANKIIKDAKRQKDDSIKKAEEKHKGVVAQAKKQAKGQAREVDWTRGTVLTNWQKLVLGVAEAMGNITDGINWVLRKIGLKHLQIPKWFPKGMTELIMGYEKGTSRQGHPGGPAIVGEKGRELAHIPGQGITMLGEKGPQFLNLPKGTSVLPNKHTENLLKSYGFPGYESGIGDFFDLALSSPKKLISKVWSKFLGDLPSFGGSFKDIFSGTVSYVKKGASKYIKNKIDDFFSFGDDIGGKITGSLSKWINAAIKIAGVPQSWFKPLSTIAIKESGGNPRAINRWDINAKRGTPSMGLMQTIMPTFQAHKKRGLNNILNPVHNAVAAINYIKSRYGNVFNVPGIKAMRRGGKYVGYKTGGLIKRKGLYELAEDGWPEYVIPTNPSRRTEAMKLLALAGKDIQRNKQGNKRPSQLSDATASNDTKDYTKDLLDATLEQNNILMQILAKDNNVYLDSRSLGRGIEPTVTEIQKRNKRVRDSFA